MTKTRIIYANTKNSDMFYAVRTTIPDAFFLVELGARKVIFLDKREIGIFQEHDTGKKFEVIPLEPLVEKARQQTGAEGLVCRLALVIINEFAPRRGEAEVPAYFPLDMADFLRSRGIFLKVVHPFFPERAVKNHFEIRAIETSLKKTAAVYQRIEEILKRSSIAGDRIVFEQEALTSEFLKQEVDRVLLAQNMLNTEGIIIASGKQAALPHHQGSGPLLPNEPIICDIFPKDTLSGYFADMTRTYVKGVASPEMRKIYRAVLRAQEAGITSVKPGVACGDVHKACCDSFLKNGYDVGERGFVHNTGHGLGLDIHEPPYLSGASDDILKPGNIITVEPGLYYEERGSARIEDVLLVTETGSRNLTDYPRTLEIP
ncbi:MAG: aminopeptidase P family protein [Candidatus Liptonbacteria bacterium]|nr:aminopeptidase P family protein [Candidatus Liptonbacteria bacterium]